MSEGRMPTLLDARLERRHSPPAAPARTSLFERPHAARPLARPHASICTPLARSHALPPHATRTHVDAARLIRTAPTLIRC